MYVVWERVAYPSVAPRVVPKKMDFFGKTLIQNKLNLKI